MWWMKYKKTGELWNFSGRWGYRGSSYKWFRHCTFTSKCEGKCRQCGRCRVCHECKGCGRCRKYARPYVSECRLIRALEESAALVQAGLPFTDFEIVNIHGRTIEDMVTLPVEAGLWALRHRKEKWFWSCQDQGRVWYKRTQDLFRAWRKDETIWAQECDRGAAKTFRIHGLILVKGQADGSVEEYPLCDGI